MSMSAAGVKRALATPPGARKGRKRAVSAEQREINELLERVDRKLDHLQEQTEAILRDLDARRGA
jgi:transposase